MHTDVFDHADQLEPRIITTSGFKSRQSSNIMAANLPLRSENQGLFVLSAHTRCQFFLFIIGIRCQKIYSYDWDRYGRKTGYICRRHCVDSRQLWLPDSNTHVNKLDTVVPVLRDHPYERPPGLRDHFYQVPSAISSMLLYLLCETTCVERPLFDLP